MDTRLPNNATKRRHLARAILASGIASFLSLPSVQATSATWNGTSDAIWATGTNWSATPVPGTGDTATFNNAGGAVDVIDLGAGVTISSILFDTASVAAYTIGSGAVNSQTLTLNNGGAITANSTINANQLLNAALVLGTDATAQAYTITNSDTSNSLTLAGTITGGSTGIAGIKSLNVATAAGGVIIGGAITAGGATAIALTKTGAGTLRLNGVNTLGDVTVSDGTLFTENSMTFGNLSVATNKTFQFGAQDAVYTINIKGLSGAGTVTTANSGGFQRNLTLGNNDATAEFSGVITQASNRPLVLTKTGIGTQTLSGSTANTQAGGTGVGFDTYVSAGSLVLNKTAAIALPGDVFISGGTLQLSGTGDNQIADTAALNWSSGAFDLNGKSETVGALTISVLSASANQINVAAGKTFTAAGNVNIFNSAATTLGTNVTFNSAGSVPTSTFAVTGANAFIFGQDSTTESTTRTNTLDMRNLGVFNAGTSSTALTKFVLGNYVQAVGVNYSDGGINTAYLAPSSTIYATALAVGDRDTGANPGKFTNTLYLGSGTTALHATTITVGEVGAIDSAGSTIKWNTGVTGGALTLNGTGATSAVTDMYVGYKTDTSSGSSGGTRLGTMDLSNGTVTGAITNLYVGYKTSNDSGTAPATTTGVFKIGAGTAGASSSLTIGNLYLATTTGTSGRTNNPVNGTFQLDGGSVTVTNDVALTNAPTYQTERNGTLTINGGTLTVNGNITAALQTDAFATSTLTLSGGTLDMTGGDIGTSANRISAFNSSGGTLANLGSIYVGTMTATNAVADNATTTLAASKTLSVNGAGGLTVGKDGGASGSNVKLTATGAGALAVNNAAANVLVGVASSSTSVVGLAALDLSGLASVTLGNSTTAINELRIGYGQQTVGTLTLSNTANTINANIVVVGDSQGVNTGGGSSQLILGTGTNVIGTDTLNIAMSKGFGTVKFASQTAGSPGTVTLTAQDGVSGVNITVGNTVINTSASTTGLLDLRGHTATVTAGTVILGNSTNTSGSPSGTLSFDAGTFTATTLNMGTLAAASGAFNSTGTLNIGGGTFTVGTLGVANKSAAGTGTATGNINVSGGSLVVNTGFTLATRATAGASAGTLTITASGLVTSNVNILDGGGTFSTSAIALNGGTLNLTGHNLGDATNAIDTFTFTTGTLQDIGIVYGPITLASGTHTFFQNGNAGEIKGAIGGGAFSITKTGVQTLTLSHADNTYTGATQVTDGTLEVSGSLSGTNIVQLDGGSMLLSGTSGTQIQDGATVNLNGGKLAFANAANQTETLGVLTLSANSTLDFGAGGGADKFLFAALPTRTGGILTIDNWIGNTVGGTDGTHDRLVFLGNITAPGSFADVFGQAQVSFIGFGSGYATIDLGGTSYEIVPVPEPSTLFGVVGLLGLIGIREGRRLLMRRRETQLSLGS